MTDSTYSTTGDGKQGAFNLNDNKTPDAAEQLLVLYGCDAKVHVEQRGFSGIRDDGKHLFDKPQTIHTPLSVFHVKAHLMGKYRASCVPLLANDTAVCGRIDLDLDE